MIPYSLYERGYNVGLLKGLFVGAAVGLVMGFIISAAVFLA